MHLPKIFKWNIKDFGDDVSSVGLVNMKFLLPDDVQIVKFIADLFCSSNNTSLRGRGLTLKDKVLRDIDSVK